MDKKVLSEVEKKNIEHRERAYRLCSAHDAAMFDLFDDDIIEKQDPTPSWARRLWRSSTVPSGQGFRTCGSTLSVCTGDMSWGSLRR
ncbi:MAG: hypothetical protein C4296_14575 [Gemmataceae bacterium]